MASPRYSGGGIDRCKLKCFRKYDLRLTYESSPGLEEYIEALSFLHYLEKQSLITLTEIQSTLSDSETGKQVRQDDGNV